VTPSELLRAYYRAIGEPDLSSLDDLFLPDAEWCFPGATLRGGAAVRRSMERSLATGLRLRHVIGHMLEQGDTAICELVADNVLDGQSFLIHGAVVCEVQDGRIKRMAAYPDAAEMTPFVAALEAAIRRQHAAGGWSNG
jgi:ketosteroid isomerase-like protein